MAYWKNGDLSGARTLLSRSLEVIERVAAELPPSLRSVYRSTPVRQAVRDSLRRLRAGLLPSTTAMRRMQMQESRIGLSLECIEKTGPTATRRSSGGRRLYSLCFKALDRVSGSDSMVLIRGESGTGKELVASALHEHSPERRVLLSK